MGKDDFAAQLAAAAKLNQEAGEGRMRTAVLRWANENKDALLKAGLVESLLKVCAE